MDAHVLTKNEGKEEEYDTSRTEEIKMVEIAETDIIQPLEQDLEAGPPVGANHIINRRNSENCSQRTG